MVIVSVIIPIYNAQSTLSKCLNSILKSSYTEFEIILVDDGSTDCSREICEQYINLYNNKIKGVFLSANVGAAEARNIGIDNAQGEYVMFVDSDDIVSNNFIDSKMQILCDNESESSCEILPVSSFEYAPQLLGEKNIADIQSRRFYNRQNLYLFYKNNIGGYVCNTIFSLRIIMNNSIRFQPRKQHGDINEDLKFVLTYAKYINKIIYTGFADYCYFNTNPNSLSSLSNDFTYYIKYKEKYNLWRNYILATNYQGQKKDLLHLANSTLWHFIIALRKTKLNLRDEIKLYNEVVGSKEMSEILQYSSDLRENKYVISLIKGKHYFLLWLLFKIK